MRAHRSDVIDVDAFGAQPCRAPGHDPCTVDGAADARTGMVDEIGDLGRLRIQRGSKHPHATEPFCAENRLSTVIENAHENQDRIERTRCNTGELFWFRNTLHRKQMLLWMLTPSRWRWQSRGRLCDLKPNSIFSR